MDFSDTVGMYFSFMRTSIVGLGPGRRLIFVASNSRTGECGDVMVLGRKEGSVGDAIGRFNSNPVEAREGQWELGDRLIIRSDGCNSGRYMVLII